MKRRHLLVIGAGSVGKRHLRNFASLGCDLSAVDPRKDRLAESGREVELKNAFLSLEKALSVAREFDAVVIASPPKFHIDQALAFLKRGVPVLLEKPLAKTLADGRKLSRFTENPGAPSLLLGYTYRWWPSLRDLRTRILTGQIGKPLHATFQMSAHLADWHPWEKYQDFFMSSRDLGGGALLDESHWIDLMVWFFGMPTEVFSKVERISDLAIETDDNVELLGFYKNGFRVNMHLDLYGRPPKKFIAVTGDKGSLEWRFETDVDRNIMFMNLAKDFLKIVNGEKEIFCGLDDGLNVMKIIEAARKSSLLSRVIKV